MSCSKPYQHFLSNPIAKPPCRMTNAKMYGFFAQIDEVKVQRLIDNTLNVAATPYTRFEGIGEYALITFTDIEKIASLTPPYDQHGWMQETDIIIWLPVAKMVEQGGDESITHLYLYPAFICVNNIYALINGRETWGYNKYMWGFFTLATLRQAAAPPALKPITVVDSLTLVKIELSFWK